MMLTCKPTKFDDDNDDDNVTDDVRNHTNF